jgi:hypothetical protein
VTVLFDGGHRVRLAPFVRDVRTIAAVARQLDEDVRTSAYHVRRYVEIGLLEAVGERRRAGRPQTLYRSVADGFFVPPEHFPGIDRSEAVERLIRPTLRSMHRDAVAAIEPFLPPDSGRYVALRGDVLWLDAGPDPRRGVEGTAALYARPEVPPVWLAIEEVRLPEAAAKELQLELIRLTERLRDLANQEDANDRSYRLLVQLAPRRDDRPTD